MKPKHPIFYLDHVSFRFTGSEQTHKTVVNDIQLIIEQGESIALVGANGSGKTTLARMMNALLLPLQGNVYVNGLNTRDRQNHASIRLSIGMVFQHPQEQMVASSVEEDVAFGLENYGLPTSEIRQRVEQSLRKIGLWQDRRRPPQQLSEGQIQKVALAGILAMQPSAIILDEATAMLDPLGRQTILNWIQLFNKEGITTINITHYMEEAVMADRILAMKDGSLAFDGNPGQLFSNSALLQTLQLDQPPVLATANRLAPWLPELDHPLTLQQFEQQLQHLPEPIFLPELTSKLNDKKTSVNLISARGLSFSYQHETTPIHYALNEVGFDVKENHVHGFMGATGSGKSTLMQHINGLYLPDQGTLQVGPFTVNKNTNLIELRRYVGIVFQNPAYQLFEQYVGDEIAYGLRLRKVVKPELRERVKNAMKLAGLDFDTFKDRPVFSLSGGERRKTALAATLAMDPQILILDEPGAGLDPAARQELTAVIGQLKQQGKTILLSSHNMEEMAELSQEITLLDGGHTVQTASSQTILSNTDLLEQHQMLEPVTVQMAQILRQKNWRLPADVILPEHLAESFSNWSTIHE